MPVKSILRKDAVTADIVNWAGSRITEEQASQHACDIMT